MCAADIGSREETHLDFLSVVVKCYPHVRKQSTDDTSLSDITTYSIPLRLKEATLAKPNRTCSNLFFLSTCILFEHVVYPSAEPHYLVQAT